MFPEESITDNKGWNLHLKLNAQDIIDKYPDKINDIKYIVTVLWKMKYIELGLNNPSEIQGLSDLGYKFLFSYLHHIELN